MILACRSGSSADLAISQSACLSFSRITCCYTATVHYERDVQGLLEQLRRRFARLQQGHPRLLQHLWNPLLRLALHCGCGEKTPEENWIANEDIWNFLLLAGYELLRHEANSDANFMFHSSATW